LGKPGPAGESYSSPPELQAKFQAGRKGKEGQGRKREGRKQRKKEWRKGSEREERSRQGREKWGSPGVWWGGGAH